MLLFLILATKAGSNNSVSSQEANLALSETRSVQHSWARWQKPAKNSWNRLFIIMRATVWRILNAMRCDATTGNGKCWCEKNLVKSRFVNLFLAGLSHLKPLFVVAAKQNNKKILLQSQMDGKREREWKKSLELLSFWHEKATEYEVEQEAVFFERCDCLPSCSPSYTPIFAIAIVMSVRLGNYKDGGS